MSEHNKNFYSLEEVERCLEATKDFQDGEEIYYFIGALRYVYDENKQLKSQLQQKENCIKEVREEIIKDRKKQYSDLEKKAFYCNKTNKLLEILNNDGDSNDK